MSRRASRNGCPLCGQPVSPDHRPFCGQGCRDRDLLGWLNEGYRLPGPVAGDDAMREGLDMPETRD